jgi:hypothetical protein
MAAGSCTLFGQQPRCPVPASGRFRSRRSNAWRRLAANEPLAQPSTAVQGEGAETTALAVVDKAQTALVGLAAGPVCPYDASFRIVTCLFAMQRPCHPQARQFVVQVQVQPSASESPAPAVEQSARFSLYNWLRFGGLPTATAAAAAPAELQHACVSQLGDGMAAEPLPVAAAAPPSRRGFLAMRRGSPSRQQAVPEQATDPQLNADHSTLRLLRQRLAESSKPGSRKDAFKLGLVVEGGGMRGCVSAGGLQALSDLGIRDVFDAVYGSSAGAINSTYFLSGQREGVYIYHDHIAHNEVGGVGRSLVTWRYY